MSNPLYGMMNNGQNMSGFWQRLNQLKQTFKGDPNEQIQKMLNSGQITQAQYNNAVRQAEQIRKMMGK